MRKPYPEILAHIDEALRLARQENSSVLVYILENAKQEAEHQGDTIEPKLAQNDC